MQIEWIACVFRRLVAIPVVLFYLLILFSTQYTSYLGPASLLETARVSAAVAVQRDVIVAFRSAKGQDSSA